jgi:hypothetical protein
MNTGLAMLVRRGFAGIRETMEKAKETITMTASDERSQGKFADCSIENDHNGEDRLSGGGAPSATPFTL